MQTLKVTQSHINESRERRTASTLDRQRKTYNSERDCPIGIALADQFEAPREYVRAHPDYLSIRHQAEWVGDREQFKATQAIRDFMRDWDRYGRAEPHNFKLIDR